METVLTIFNWVMLISSCIGFFKALYYGSVKNSIISGVLLTIFMYTMFFYHPS